MALGCAFIFLVILMLWRRHARKRRAKATALFATAKRLDRPQGWRGRLVAFGERLFGHRRPAPATMPLYAPQPVRLEKLRTSSDASDAHASRDMDKLLGAYDYSRAGSSRGPSPLPSLRDHGARHRFSGASLTHDSLYSHATGLPRSAPEPRQPVRTNPRDLLPSRFSATTASTREPEPSPPLVHAFAAETSRPPTPAQEYARMVSLGQPAEPRGAYWLEPTNTGNSASKNPFLLR